jgi:hypothetical protein
MATEKGGFWGVGGADIRGPYRDNVEALSPGYLISRDK